MGKAVLQPKNRFLQYGVGRSFLQMQTLPTALVHRLASLCVIQYWMASMAKHVK